MHEGEMGSEMGTDSQLATAKQVEFSEGYSFGFWENFVVSFFPRMVQTGSRPLLKFLCWFFLRWEVEGIENLKKMNTNAIFAPIHVHELDSFMIGAALPWFTRHIPLYYVSKPKWLRPSQNKIFAAVYGSWIFPLMGAIAINPGHQDYEKSLEKHLALLRQGKNLCIFPEGQLRKPGREMRARGGIAYLLEQTGLPAIPVKIEGIDYSLKLSELFTRKRKLKITFRDPVYFNDLKREVADSEINEYQQISQMIIDKINEVDK